MLRFSSLHRRSLNTFNFIFITRSGPWIRYTIYWCNFTPLVALCKRCTCTLIRVSWRISNLDGLLLYNVQNVFRRINLFQVQVCHWGGQSDVHRWCVALVIDTAILLRIALKLSRLTPTAPVHVLCCPRRLLGSEKLIITLYYLFLLIV